MSPSTSLRLSAAALACAALTLVSSAAPDAAKVMGPESCGECHKQEVEAWKATHHFSTVNEMHRTDAARVIADRLGIRRVKSESVCIECHYTSQGTGSDLNVIAGVSCESCHGAAKEWINLHNDYGKGFTRDTEPAEHRAKRKAASAAAGLLYPQNVYEVAQNCFQCHIVTDEKLVNVGGHAPGSTEFELVAYSQGEVRHNFLGSGGKTNAANTPARLRQLYVVGALLDLEYSLRAVARATERANYAVVFARRVKAVEARLTAIDAAAPTPEVKQALAAIATVALRLNNSDELTAAADKVQAAARAFAGAHDGSNLAPLDSLLPAPATYKGTSYQPPAGS